MIEKFAKLFAWLFISALGLVVLFYLVLLAINWHDASPTPEVVRFTESFANRPQVADEVNAFVYMVGMSVEPTHEPMLAGIALIDRAKKNTSDSIEIEYSHPDHPQVDLNKDRPRDLQRLLDSCSSIDEKCLGLLDGRTQPANQLGPYDVLLLNRYRTLITLPEWQDIYPNGQLGTIPQLKPVLSGQTLSMLDIWQHARGRGAKATIGMLEQDARFWRKVLLSSDSLITSMVARNALKKNILWTNLVLRRLSSNNNTVNAPDIWLEPISDEERLMERAWIGEWALGGELMRNLSAQIKKQQDSGDKGNSSGARVVTWLMLPLYQPQDSINRYAQDLVTLINEHNVPYERLGDVAAKRKGAYDGAYEEVIATPRILYNPVGKLLWYSTKPDYERFMSSVSDLEGCRRALLATHQMRVEQISRDRINVALASSMYRNPYTNQPFVWDEESGSVSFDGLKEGKQKSYSFLY